MWRKRALLGLLMASGFAGLGYQIVWSQQCGLWLGHESAAVLAVVTAFFGGLAVGAFVLGSCIARSARPARWYAACEVTIGLWSSLLLALMPPFSAAALRLTGVQPAPAWQWSVAFAGTFLLLLPATAAMGATLPAMERLVARAQGEAQSIAALYASNTFGAVAGVLAAAFWSIPTIGLARTAGISIALNFFCGAGALLAFPGAAPDVSRSTVANTASMPLLARLTITGFLGIGFEVLVVRALSQVTEDTVYTFALLLAVYLIGSAAGATTYQRWSAARTDGGARTDRLLGALGGACLLGGAALWGADELKAFALHAFGGGLFAALATEAVLAIAAFGPATVAMGALFSNLGDEARARGVSFGRALGANTLGAAAAPVVWGVVAIPWLGPKAALVLIAVGYLALTSRHAWRKPLVWAPAGVALAIGLISPPLRFVDVPAGGHVVSYREGAMAAVSVVEDANGVARLRINDRQQEGSSATFRFDARQAWLPLLLHPAPAHALFLGLGTGVTARAAADDPNLRVDAVELLPEVIEASAAFAREPGAPAPPNLEIVAADARRYVRVGDRRYDVIVSDNFHPARSGSAALYTVEHFEAVRRRLSAGGVFCQWLPLHQLDLETLRNIVQSFVAAFPQGWAMLASNSLETPVIGLVGRDDAERFDAAAIRDRLMRAPPPPPVAGIGLEDELAVLGSFVAGPAALKRLARDAAANTDDRPIVAYLAPRITYAPDSQPRDRLLALLNEVTIEPSELLAPTTGATSAQRLAAYWLARDRFIATGRDVRPSPRVQEMLAQVREPLLAVLRISPDFRPAYDPLFAMATALARSDLSGARGLLTELSRIQPARGEAARAISALDGESATTPR